VTTVSLVQGECLGGGFEAALSSHVVIAERSARFGFPEIMFNLFPGMGAWHLVVRKAGMVVATDMILSGQIYTADQLQRRSLVAVVDRARPCSPSR
jgi:DSF synthase